LGRDLGLENVVRGDSVFSPGAESRLQSPGAAISLIDDLTDKASKDCPVAAALTDADRAKLLQIKQGIEEAGKS
jgi:organic hydroperoxide reductase OsmC/OhrA